ncbi:MAG TPA: YggS family pyridoxal phosphate-dependent enzyme [Acidimicrobiales bacterium]|nr:YggS family pyridoxal phosphate-dependent enzyme [Acidimicrobiales bacterium]
MAGLADRLGEIRERIARAGGDWRAISLVAVTKDFGPEAVEAALEEGVVDIGENRADQLTAKAAAITRNVRWHYLARVQRNKVAALASHVALWQAVDRLAAGEEIAKRAPGAAVLVQVNVSGEPQKHGAGEAGVPSLVEDLTGLGLDVRGLMAVGPTGPPEAARAAFKSLVVLADRLALPVRSMGMTDDLEVAVQEGTTMLRIGRGLFGPRNRAR